jgi:ABC-type antimicrobial peptide transport system permease subunit
MTAFFLILFGLRSIKQNSYQIGVIKALGGRNVDVQKIFVIKTFIIGIIIAIVSTATSVLFIGAADKVLIASIETVLKLNVEGFEVIRFMPRLIAFDAVLMIFLSFISALIPAILLKKIKPVEIIKAKE